MPIFKIAVHLTITLMLLSFLSGMVVAEVPSASDDLAVVNQTWQPAADRSELIASINRLRQLPADQLTTVLDAIDDSNPVAANMLRGIAGDIARQQSPSIETLTAYIRDQTRPADARSLVLRMIQRRNPEVANAIVDQSLDDSSLWIRRLAVAAEIEKAQQAISRDEKQSALKTLRSALVQARHPNQVTEIAGKLQDLGDDLTTAAAMSMIQRWHLVGPFENSGGVGFATAYPPELDYLQNGRIDLSDRYPGKTGRGSDLADDGSVGWRTEVADDNGTVDIAKHFNKEKGAAAYAYVEIDADVKTAAQIRVKSVTANKVWVNGVELMSNAIYHSGTTVDQYVAAFDLNQGTNTILIKTCQNEQTEGWAQEWELQCRITDPTGKGLTLQ